MAKKTKEETDISSEEKIKDAARTVFTKKGYAATRTRDIAEEAGINLALLNYYFRSKEKLFEIIMAEKMEQFFGILEPALSNASTTLDDKIEIIVSKYIDLLTDDPELPLFILSEIRSSPDFFAKAIGSSSILLHSAFVKQIQQQAPDLNPMHFVFNLIGMSIFPFIMNPVLKTMGVVNDENFAEMMKERKALIPIWLKAELKRK